MVPLARFAPIFPLLLALVAFVLSCLALFAGNKQGFMEDYALVRLNTSMIGQNLFDKAKGQGGAKGGGLLGDIQNLLDDKKDGVRDKLNDIAGAAVDKLTSELGISQWYSLHIMDSCEGVFDPNPTAPSPGLRTTNCTTSSPSQRLNLTQIIDGELSLGPLHAKLSDIDWPEGVQDKIDLLNDALLSLFIVYVLAVGFSGLSMLLAGAAMALPGRPAVVLANLIVAGLGALACLIGSVVVLVAASKAADQINQRGARIGVSAECGCKFAVLCWVATGLMLATAAFWVGHLLARRRERSAAEQGGRRLSASCAELGTGQKVFPLSASDAFSPAGA